MISRRDEKIKYYHVPIIKSTDKCCYCNCVLEKIDGEYFGFFDKGIFTVKSIFHYCDKCRLGYKTIREIDSDIELLSNHNQFENDIFIRTIDADSNDKVEVKRATKPRRASDVSDKLLMQSCEDDISIILEAVRILLSRDISFDVFKILRTATIISKRSEYSNLNFRELLTNYQEALSDEQREIIHKILEDNSNDYKIRFFNTIASNEETDNEETDNEETNNEKTDNEETNNEETDNEETNNEETDNEETNNEETDNEETNNEKTDNEEIIIVPKAYFDLSRFVPYIDWMVMS